MSAVTKAIGLAKKLKPRAPHRARQSAAESLRDDL